MKAILVKFFVILFLILNLVDKATAQDDPFKTLISNLQNYQSKHPYEKVYLHLDKPYYAIGDNIWFKAYVVQAERNRPSTLSKILYAELINERDSIVQTVRLPLIVGLAWGEFSLTASLKEGNYRVRAYTQWMRNFGQDFYYDRTIAIGNAITNHIITNVNYSYSIEGSSRKLNADLNFRDLDGNLIVDKDLSYELQDDKASLVRGTGKTDAKGNIRLSFANDSVSGTRRRNINTTLKLDSKRSVVHSFPVKPTTYDIDLHFFPEGGDLIAGLRSVVAFKASDPQGLGGAKGYLIDGDNKQITELRTGNRGVGTFEFRPVSGQTYKAELKFADGTVKIFQLPAVKPEGYVLSVSSTNQENITVNVSANTNFPDEEVTLIAQSNNKIQLVSKNKLIGSRFSVTIPAKRFPQGILQLTLLSSKNEPMAERLVFINHNEQLNIDIKNDVKESLKKNKAKLSLTVTDKDNKPVAGSFSISVIDETRVPYDENKETTILSNLLLTSDLKGYVHQPNYFFTGTDSTRAKELDMLMLTQGWRRFSWKDVQTDDQPLAFLPEQGISLSGRVSQSGKPVEKGKVMLFYLDGKPITIDTLTDDQGKFAFNNLHFPDGTKLVLQASNERGNKNVMIELNQLARDTITKNKNLNDIEINVNGSMLSYLKNSVVQFDSLRQIASSSILLDEVRVVEKKIDLSTSRNLNGPGIADDIVAGAKVEAFCVLNILECLQGLFTGLTMVDGTPYLVRSGSNHMLILVDGMEIAPKELAYIQPADIEFIEVMKTAVNTIIYGSKGAHGVLLITLKRGKPRVDTRPSNTPGLVQFHPTGFHKVREFYSPDYSKATDTTAPDYRTTMYWNPGLVTDKEGKASVEFFNGDREGSYKVVVEGIDGYGNVGRRVVNYRVR